MDRLREALPSGPLTPEANALVGSDDRWTVNFSFRALPLVHIPPSGTWRHHRAGDVELWRDPLPSVEDATALLVRRTLAAFGPILVDGFVAGGWRLDRGKSKGTLSLEPFAPLPRAIRRELLEEGERFVRWLEDDAPTHAVTVEKP